MVLCRKVSPHHADQTDEQKDRSNKYMEAMETSRHEKVRAVDISREAKARMAVFICLEACEQSPKRDGYDQTPFHIVAVFLMYKGVVGPCCRST